MKTVSCNARKVVTNVSVSEIGNTSGFEDRVIISWISDMDGEWSGSEYEERNDNDSSSPSHLFTSQMWLIGIQ